ncbi:glycerol-3-phosphate 1-O-acyltransferase PlsY [Candidatus Contubernalis alkaliaceticus]|uniref:glycerol-3-phosphate 1-O-acyltransferase PlsY n=1 Tax=Candidatus Contubernalis alkaliaceticus TaxID=338645 RepID=UPI001F4BE77A|nr:glycerol-3-phosphate 1-O-acyltransferase PlsY [Candidatus Contubernalis alkalaceticus]UNC92471.1 glycerol-3-phosphate 1-O-acyltransferase PlsY [Candidatus Contubernalis alkalaceticus]
MGLLIIAFSYLLGSISFGYLFVKYLKGVDIREHGSGSTGATNIMRILGVGPGVTVFLLDALKGFFSVYAAKTLTGNPYIEIASAVAVVAGHNWPLFFGFKGGRGIATSLGALTGLFPKVTLILAIIGFSVVGLSKFVSLGSVVGAVSLPFLIWFFVEGHNIPYLVFGTFLSLLAVARHIPNLKRIRAGTESKIGQRIKVDSRK